MAHRKIAETSTCKIYQESDWDEYIVKPNGEPKSAWYFTDDKQDALDTAKAIDRSAGK